MKYLVGSLLTIIVYGIVRVVIWIKRDLKNYYVQCELDEMRAKLIAEGKCAECGTLLPIPYNSKLCQSCIF